MKTHMARFWLGIAIPVATMVVGFGSWLLWHDDLPSQVATHFDLSGTADSASEPSTALVAFGVPLVVGALLCGAVAAWAHRLSRVLAVSLAFTGGTLASLLAAMFAATVWTQRGLTEWTNARLSPLALVGVIIVGVGGGMLAGWFASFLGEPEAIAQAGDPNAPVMELRDGESAVWVETQTFRPIVVAATVVIAGSLVSRFVFVDRWLTLAAPCLIALIMLAFASYRLRVDAQGLHVRSALLPWPSMHLAVEDIETASVIDVRPMEWGGWGYRGSLKLMNQAALVQRAGPGMRVDLRGPRVFVVTTDSPETPVALLNAFALRGKAAA